MGKAAITRDLLITLSRCWPVDLEEAEKVTGISFPTKFPKDGKIHTPQQVVLEAEKLDPIVRIQKQRYLVRIDSSLQGGIQQTQCSR